MTDTDRKLAGEWNTCPDSTKYHQGNLGVADCPTCNGTNRVRRYPTLGEPWTPYDSAIRAMPPNPRAAAYKEWLRYLRHCRDGYLRALEDLLPALEAASDALQDRPEALEIVNTTLRKARGDRAA